MSFLTPRLLEAVSLAARVHGNMTRKGDGLPFLVHPIAVFGLLAHWNANEDTCIAGLLHDVLEDAPEEQREALRAEIERQFGEKVVNIIEALTEDESLPWLERKKIYIQHLKETSEDSLLVSCADQTHNTRALLLALERRGEGVWQKFTAPKEIKMQQMSLICRALQERLDPRYTEELAKNIALIDA